jgi:hypothetical protein
METDQQRAQAEFDSILRDENNPRHGLLMRGDQATQQHMSELSRRITPEPPSEPPPTPVPQPATAKPPAESWGSLPAELSTDEQTQLRAETARGIDELKNRWGDKYDANLQDAGELRDVLFDRRNADDMEAYLLINGLIGSNPDFADLLRGHKATFFDRLKSSGPVDILGLSPEREHSLLVALERNIFKDTNTSLAKEVAKLGEIDADGRLRKWALKTAVRIFGR